LSAASGLAVAGAHLYVIADDELHLGCFEAGGGPGRLERLFPGELPHDRAARKARKPDLEVLTRWDGQLLALGSASTRHRCAAALLPLDAAGAIAGPARILDFGELRSALESRFASPNIEGGCIVDREVILLQRANARDRVNALVALPVETMAAAIGAGAFPRDASLRCVEVALPDLDAPLSLTDCAALPDGRIVFTAVAENAPDSYHDGPCNAAAVGLLDIEGRLLRIDRLEPTCKVEGVHAWVDGGALRLLLVTDADDAAIPATLLEAQFA